MAPYGENHTCTETARGDAQRATPPCKPAPSACKPDKQCAAKRGSLRGCAALIPSILGLSFALCGWPEKYYGRALYTNVWKPALTESKLLFDGAMLAALGVLMLLLLILEVSKYTLPKRAANRLAYVCIFGQAACFAVFAVCEIFHLDSMFLNPVLGTAALVMSSGAIFYWLRHAREAAPATAALYVFSAVIAGKIIVYGCSFLPAGIRGITYCILVLMQYPCILRARKHDRAFSTCTLTRTSDYFGFVKDLLINKRLLWTTSVGIGCLAVVAGFSQGYLCGQSQVFTFLTRMAQLVQLIMIVSLSVLIIALVLRRHRHTMTVDIFVLMEVLACLALFCFAAFPDTLAFESIFSATLDTLLMSATCYVVIVFMGYGWRDPYYYALGGWITWLGGRALACIVLLNRHVLALSELLICAIMGIGIVVSAQVMFMQFLKIVHLKAHQQKTQWEAQRETQRETPASFSSPTKRTGLNERESQNEIRRASMQHNAREMGQQFMLSEREVEVLALYSLGFTQKRVAEELFISPATAHAHIKRIYAKTDLHSRQDIIDYMQKYTS